MQKGWGSAQIYGTLKLAVLGETVDINILFFFPWCVDGVETRLSADLLDWLTEVDGFSRVSGQVCFSQCFRTCLAKQK